MAVINAYRNPRTEEEDLSGSKTSPLKDLVDAIVALVDSLAKAPTWIAMFGGAVLLLWMAGSNVPSFCAP